MPSRDTSVQEKTEEEEILYDRLSITAEPAFNPMITVAVVTVVLYAIVALNPSFIGPGEGDVPLYTYGVTGLVFVVVILGFLYDYWVERNVENSNTRGDRA